MTQRIPSADDLRHRTAIADCKARYCYLIDDWELEALPSLFTEDVILDYGGIGTYTGHEGIREFASVIEETLDRTTHLLSNPVIDIGVDGSPDAISDDPSQATGRWYVFSTINYADGSSGVRVGTYRDRYRRVDDRWLIAESHLRFTHSVDYDPEGANEDENAGRWPQLTAHSSSQS
ncbi:nuclear transport factor 2 family protein [Natrialbaceae archaeon A-CW1-1]